MLPDTDYVVNFLQGRSDTVPFVNSLTDAGTARLSAITVAEVLEGIFFGRNPVAAERAFQTWLRSVPVLVVNQDVARNFAHLRGELRQLGQLIQDMDLLIAATALHHDLTLVTRNQRHFGRVPNLRIYPQ